MGFTASASEYGPSMGVPTVAFPVYVGSVCVRGIQWGFKDSRLEVHCKGRGVDYGQSATCANSV